MAKDSQNICPKMQSELCLLYRKWIQLCTVKHATTKLERPRGSGSSSLGGKVGGGGTRLSVSGVIFQVLQINCLTSWLVIYRRCQNHSPVLYLGWCHCYRLQLAQDPARAHFSSESDRWQIAALDASMATMQECCTVTAHGERWAQLKLSSTLLQHASGCSNSEAASISSISLPPGRITTVAR